MNRFVIIVCYSMSRVKDEGILWHQINCLSTKMFAFCIHNKYIAFRSFSFLPLLDFDSDFNCCHCHDHVNFCFKMRVIKFSSFAFDINRMTGK
jgi:hypothetical protein